MMDDPINISVEFLFQRIGALTVERDEYARRAAELHKAIAEMAAANERLAAELNARIEELKIEGAEMRRCMLMEPVA